jgi:UDP-N-acetylglucosamine:LPS N-acetylglucosamine transferase
MPFAHVIFTPFKITAKYCYLFGKQFTYKCRPCNYPIRFTEQDNNKDKAIIINIINKLITPNIQPFTHVRKTLFLLGGSQGSLALNNALKDFLQKHTEEYKLQERIQIIHQTGTVSDFDWTKFYRQLGIAAFTFSYHAHVEDFYVLADLVLCRAGAGTIFEVAFFEKQCIVIPLIARSTTHQIQNAQEIVKQYPLFFTLIEQKIITTNPGALHELILKKLSLY